MTGGSWLKSEDRKRKEPGVNPARVLEALGIDSFAIDWETCTVYVTDLHRVANYFDKPVHQEARTFFAYGWTWKEAVNETP
jgi:hypothetical protein